MMDKNLFFYELEGRGYTFENMTWLGNCFEDDMLNMAWEMWSSAKHSVKAQAVPESNALLSASLDAIQKLGSGDFVLVPKEPSADLVNHGHQVFLGHFNEGGQTGGRSIYFAYKAMIEAQEPAPLKLGDLVEPIDHRYTLASGCERYPYAYVVNTNPFQLMSEEGDMYWCCTVEAGGYKLIKSNDQLPEAVSLRMIREGLLAPVEAQEQSHD